MGFAHVFLFPPKRAGRLPLSADDPPVRRDQAQEVRQIDTENIPELGTTQAAVTSCEALIYSAMQSGAALTPVQVRYWLDLYYQVRAAHERERRAGLPPVDREELLDALREIWLEVVATPKTAPAPKTRAPRQYKAPTVDKAFKQDVSRRLEQARADGVTIPELRKAGSKDLNDDMILSILEAKPSKPEYFTEVDKALRALGR